MGISEIVSSLGFSGTDINQLVLRTIFSLVIILVGIFLGRLLRTSLKKASQKLDINKYIRGSFIDLFLVVIELSIYILFINLGLNYLGIPALTNFLTNILIVIPAFTGALVILAIGFAIAIYLREVIEDAEITGWDLISKVIFYFILFITGIYAIKTALIPISEELTNWIIIVLTATLPITIAILITKKQRQSHE